MGWTVRYRTGFWNGRPLKTHMTPLAAALGELGAWVRLHYVYPYPHVDEVSAADGGRVSCCLIWTCRCSTPARAF
jgi:tRNA A37 methylthiotransferase MiaB